MTEQLKPCPFCGGEPILEGAATESKIGIVDCFNCGLSLVVPKGANWEAIWNTRAPQSVVVKPLDLPERRNGYWGHKHGYQVAHTIGDTFRVKLHGRVICKNIKGFDRAVAWANDHNRHRILSQITTESVTVQEAARVLAEWIDSDMVTVNEIVNAMQGVKIEMPVRHWLSQVLRAIAGEGE
ncbi:MAG: Lar family restriction alleviation protein [Pelagimonas sp.]|jgi:hypothetical protein|nr:Lar family restriction alleviation protein [Pelagimonas sp.]